MANFFTRLFGKSRANERGGDVEQSICDTLDGVISRGDFKLDYEIQATEEGFSVNFSGEDSELVTGKEGLLLDSFQIFLKRMLQNQFPDRKIDVQVDCDGFVEASSQELRDLAEKLKSHVIEKGGTSYVRALPPRERKVVHRYLAEDQRVKSQSIGDGFCKKIKISLVQDSARRAPETRPESSL